MRAPAVAFAIVALLAPAALGQNVGGKYQLQGTNFDGSGYRGTVTITPSSNSTCRIEWQTGGTSSAGFCMLSGTAVAAAYKLESSIGLVLYQLQPDGSLKGVWTLADKPGAGTEVLSPLR